MPYNGPTMGTETAKTKLARLYAACPAAFPGSDPILKITPGDRVVARWRNLRVEADTEAEACVRICAAAEDALRVAVGIWQHAARMARADEESARQLALLMEQQVQDARRAIPRVSAAA